MAAPTARFRQTLSAPGLIQKLRDVLDMVKPEALRPCFEALHHELQRGKVLEDFVVLGDYFLLAIEYRKY